MHHITRVYLMKQSRTAYELSPKQPNTDKSLDNVIAFTGVSEQRTTTSQQSFTAKLPPRKPKNVDRREREHLTPHEVKALVEAAKKIGRYGFRDAAIILISYRHALRVGELVDLRWDHVDFTAGKLFVKRLKRGDASVHYLEGDELRILRKLKQSNPDSPFIFTTERNTPISTRHVRTIVFNAGEEAALGFPVHPHMLRHAKGYHLANKGYDTRLIQSYFGHKNIQHTVAYTKLDASRFKGFGLD